MIIRYRIMMPSGLEAEIEETDFDVLDGQVAELFKRGWYVPGSPPPPEFSQHYCSVEKQRSGGKTTYLLFFRLNNTELSKFPTPISAAWAVDMLETFLAERYDIDKAPIGVQIPVEFTGYWKQGKLVKKAKPEDPDKHYRDWKRFEWPGGQAESKPSTNTDSESAPPPSENRPFEDQEVVRGFVNAWNARHVATVTLLAALGGAKPLTRFKEWDGTLEEANAAVDAYLLGAPTEEMPA